MGDFGDFMSISPMFSPIIFPLYMYTSLLVTLVPQAEVTSIKDMLTSILLTSWWLWWHSIETFLWICFHYKLASGSNCDNGIYAHKVAIVTAFLIIIVFWLACMNKITYNLLGSIWLNTLDDITNYYMVVALLDYSIKLRPFAIATLW